MKQIVVHDKLNLDWAKYYADHLDIWQRESRGRVSSRLRSADECDLSKFQAAMVIGFLEGTNSPSSIIDIWTKRLKGISDQEIQADIKKLHPWSPSWLALRAIGNVTWMNQLLWSYKGDIDLWERKVLVTLEEVDK